MFLRIVKLSFVALLLCSCGQALQTTRSFVPIVPNVRGESGTLLVRVNAHSRAMTPDYLSPASKGMIVDIKGPTKLSRTAGLKVTDKGCKSSLMTQQCVTTISGLTACPSAKACYTADVAIYDAYNAGANKIPHGAHELSAVSGLRFSIASGQTLIPLALDGLPKHVALIPATNTILAGSQSAGFVEPKCGASPQKVSVIGVDADGNYIVGPGAPRASLASNDSSQLAVKRGKSTEPNTYTLNPPKSPNYPYGGHTVILTAKATPDEKSLGHTVTAAVRISYSTDICGIFSEFSTSGGAPAGIVAGPDGNMWFTLELGDKIGRVTTAGTMLGDFTVPTAASEPGLIAVGPDHNLWFTEISGNKIGKITTSGTFNEFPVPTGASEPIGIVSGPDGNLWFTELCGNNIAKITTNGTITEYPTPTANGEPYGITVGSDNNLWFTESSTTVNKIGVMDTAASFSQDFTIPTNSSSPVGIINGPDGNLWFTECTGNRIGRISPASAQFSGSPIPTAGSKPAFLVTGPDGAVWFTEYGENRIGRLGGLQTLTEYSTPTAASEPLGITVGPDGSIWFAEAAGKIGRLR